MPALENKLIGKGGLWDLHIQLKSKTIMTGLLLCILALFVLGSLGVIHVGSGLQGMIESHAFSGRAASAASSMKSEMFDWLDRLEFREALSAASLAQNGLSRGPRPKNSPDSLDWMLITAGLLCFYIKTSEMINLEPANRRFMSQIHDQDGMK